MAKTISIHMLELCPGVKRDDFEKFVKEIFDEWDTFECRFDSAYTLYIAVE